MDDTRLDGAEPLDQSPTADEPGPTLHDDLDLEKLKKMKRARPAFVDQAMDWVASYLRPGRPLSTRHEILLSSALVAAVLFAFWVTRWPLANWPSAAPELGLYVLHPIVWTGVAVLAGYGWLRLENPPSYRPLVTGVAAGIGMLHVVALIAAGVVGGFADSPVIDWLFDYPFNVLYVATTLAAAEVARSYLFEVWRRIDRSAAYAGVTLIFAVAALNADELTPFSSLGELAEVAGARWIPVLAISILATRLVEVGGPAASFAYRGVILGFAWLWPVLPDVHWVVIAGIGLLLPWLGWLILGKAETRWTADIEDEPERRDPPGLRTPPPQDNEFLQRKRERRWWSITKPILVSITMITLIVFGLYLVFASGVTGFRLQIIDGDSMYPAYERGDTIVIDEDPNPDTLVAGDVIRVAEGDETVVRRIVDVYETVDQEFIFVTQADNGDGEELVVSVEEIAGEVVLRVPNLGNVVLWWRG